MRSAAVAAPRGTLAARAALRRSLGSQALVEIDPLTSTPRMLGRLDGTLTGHTAGDAADIAMRFVRGHLAALGLTNSDLAAFHLVARTRSPGGISHLRYEERYRGIPAFDNDLRVNVTRDGSVLSVLGSPRHALAVASVAPRISASAAVRRLRGSVGGKRPPGYAGPAFGARRATAFRNGGSAKLVLFGGRDVRLAWSVYYSAGDSAAYAGVVDARTGALLRRATTVFHAINASVFENYPGAAAGGTQHTVDLQAAGWLAGGATTLNGPNVHTFSDVNDDNVDNAGEDATPGAVAFTPFASSSNCNSSHLCSWDPAVNLSWQTNRRQNAIQDFYYANKFHDHLKNDQNIGFDAADGAFEGADKLVQQTDDGAANTTPGSPDFDHLDNANMFTPPDGQSPTMQMYLFIDDPTDGAPFRNVNGGDDAAIVYHEYTHGLSNRLITDADGNGALNSDQAGAMGEAWSDFYAESYLNDQGFQPDTAAPGEVDVGAYTDAVPNQARTQPMDCPVGAPASACPGTSPPVGHGGTGGYTYGDFGKIIDSPEAHADGEIWGETLWQLRAQIGSDAAAELVTEAMRLSPPEPSFLDERDAILQADAGINGGSHRNQIWAVFANRGMGYFASTIDGADDRPIQDFSLPPAPGAPRGTIAGTVTNTDTGGPVDGVKIAIGGLALGPDALAATTDASGHYAIANVPAHTGYHALLFTKPGWNRVVMTNVSVQAGSTTTKSTKLRRDWASLAGGAKPGATNDDLVEQLFGICGPRDAMDQSATTGWSTFNPTSGGYPKPPLSGNPAFMTVKLPAPLYATQFGIDPTGTCGDDLSSSIRDFKIETSSDGSHFTTVASGSFSQANTQRLNLVNATSSSSKVQFVRITLLSPLSDNGSGANFIDLTEFEVFGTETNAAPAGSLTASPASTSVGQPVAFDASSFHDPDGSIVQYQWDFDGNGTIDRLSTTPTTSFAYSAAGTFAARVTGVDNRGATGQASATVAVATGPKPKITLHKKGTKGRIKFKVTCSSRCTVSAKLTITKALKRKLKLKSTTLRKRKGTVPAAGHKTFTVKLTKKELRAMRRHGLKTIKAKLAVSAKDALQRKTTKKGRVRIHR